MPCRPGLVRSSRERKEQRMARKEPWAAGWARGLSAALVLATLSGRAVGDRGAPAITLRESLRAGTTTRVQTEMKAKGLYRPGLPPGDGTSEAKMPKPLSIEIETRYVFNERLLEIDRNSVAPMARTGGPA